MQDICDPHSPTDWEKYIFHNLLGGGRSRSLCVAKRVLRPILIALLVSKVYITVPYTSSELISHGDCQQPHTTWFGKHSIIPQVTINWDLKAVFSWMVVVTTQIIPPQQRRYRKRGSETWKQRFCWVLSFFLKASCFQAAPTRPTELLLYSYSTSPVLAGNFKIVVLPTAKVFFFWGGGQVRCHPLLVIIKNTGVRLDFPDLGALLHSLFVQMW